MRGFGSRVASSAVGRRRGFIADLLASTSEFAPLTRWIMYVSLAIVVLVLLAAILAPVIAPYPSQGAGNADINAIFLPPSAAHWFGTDLEGRDVLSRVLFGARPDLIAAFVVVAVAVLLGTVIGAAAGYVGGVVETLLMRLTDLFLAFPSLLLAMVIAFILRPSLTNMIISLSVSWWPWYARLVHSQASTLRHERFVVAARIAGVRRGRILLRHIIPNSLTPVLVQATADIGNVIIATAALSFLGLGVQPPAADWGTMISNGQQYILAQWWFVTFPGLAIFITATSYNLLGDTLRDMLDPSARRGLV
ncbi:MAG: ABC transporter permease [Deinococcales bacterium]|jgi:peptide/nickel transport system permease protein